MASGGTLRCGWTGLSGALWALSLFACGGETSDTDGDAGAPPDAARSNAETANTPDAAYHWYDAPMTPAREGGTLLGDAPRDAGCTSVYAEPLSGEPPDRTDQGVAGLAALRELVQASYAAFVEYARAHGDSYTYTRQFDTTFGSIGTYCETTIEVQNGEIVLRTERRAETPADPVMTWTERGDDIGTHAACHPAVTMDVLYQECLERVLCVDPRENWIWVHVDARGLLVECRYYPMTCSDDCFEGIEPLIVTADGTDWTRTSAGCCPISPEPACCMDFGGPRTAAGCGPTCDGMPDPLHPKWHVSIGDTGCLSWSAPLDFGLGCCGCAEPDAGAEDAGAGLDGGRD